MHSEEFKGRPAAAACEPGISVSHLAREHGISANMAFTWRRRYRAQPAAGNCPVSTPNALAAIQPD
ncbi:transposase [Cupriavidus sp. D39]|uniref:transposase n=1 Tax=Cupriavidus sp. D39 TaxID=2997877 RepID=UPI00227142BC|nr:transposase [Cupriavidus sp. D39]MCY0852968.1 transposase [Cupriavidus sp. D39]